MLRHLLLLQAMPYISSNPEVFYKKVFLKVSKNSQKMAVSKSFFIQLLLNEALVQAVSCECCGIGLTSNYKRQTCANVSSESVYMLCVYLNQTCCNSKKLIYYKCYGHFMISLKIKNIITQILFVGHLIKFT